MEGWLGGTGPRRRDCLKLAVILQMLLDIDDQLRGESSLKFTEPADALLVRRHTDQHAR